VAIQIAEASEEDLLAAQKTALSKAVDLEKLLAFKRRVKTTPAPAPPLQVENCECA
jgi:hypothetical protein